MTLQDNSIAKLTFVDGNNLVESLKIVKWIQTVSHLDPKIAAWFHV